MHLPLDVNIKTPESLVSALYEAFSRYRLNPPLDVCRCDACVSPETERALLTTPLKQISPELLSEFTNSAKTPGSETEMKYFLPRYFELLFEGKSVSSIALECSLNRLGYFDWKLWPTKERELVEAALKALVEAASLPGFPIAIDDFESLLVMIARAGGKPSQILRELIQAGDRAVLLRTNELSQAIKGDRMSSEFWPENKEESRAVRKLLGERDLDIDALVRGD